MVDARRAAKRRLDLLGRHVAQLAFDLTALRGLEAVARAGDAEVDDLDLSRHRQQHVLRADISVDDASEFARAIFLRVRRVQSLENLDEHEAGNERFDALAPFLQSANEPRERVAVDVLHDDEVTALIFIELEDLHHIGVVQQHRDARLVDEHVHDVLVR